MMVPSRVNHCQYSSGSNASSAARRNEPLWWLTQPIGPSGVASDHWP